MRQQGRKGHYLTARDRFIHIHRGEKDMIHTNPGRTNIAFLTLNKETLQDLSERESQAVRGGGVAEGMTVADIEEGKGGRDFQMTGADGGGKIIANTIPVFGGK
jgi:hypothetical protein